MALIDGLLQELELEAKTTRRVLERVPEGKLAWLLRRYRSSPTRFWRARPTFSRRSTRASPGRRRPWQAWTTPR